MVTRTLMNSGSPPLTCPRDYVFLRPKSRTISTTVGLEGSPVGRTNHPRPEKRPHRRAHRGLPVSPLRHGAAQARSGAYAGRVTPPGAGVRGPCPRAVANGAWRRTSGTRKAVTGARRSTPEPREAATDARWRAPAPRKAATGARRRTPSSRRRTPGPRRRNPGPDGSYSATRERHSAARERHSTARKQDSVARERHSVTRIDVTGRGGSTALISRSGSKKTPVLTSPEFFAIVSPKVPDTLIKPEFSSSPRY